MAQTIRVLGIAMATRVLHVIGMDDAGPVGLRSLTGQRRAHIMSTHEAYGHTRGGRAAAGVQ